jgi:zinc transport system substrate-binding protein
MSLWIDYNKGVLGMKKYFALLMIVSVLFVTACGTQASDTHDEKVLEDPIKVAVAIPPQKTIVERIAGDFVEVVTMIPPGYSPANYAPTQKEMASLADSAVYFSIGVPTEKVNILPLLESEGYNTKIVLLDEQVDSAYPPRYFNELHVDDESHVDHEHEAHDDHEHEAHDEHEDHEHEEGHNHAGRDPHVWLSPSRIEVMAEGITKELISLSPENKTVFEENQKAFIEDLHSADASLRELFSDAEGMTMLIYHPSLGYFADDYHIKMLALESEGKAATVQGMADVIDFAKANAIKTVFYQAEFDSKQAGLLAKEIDGKAIQIDPLSEDLVNNLLEMGKLIRNSVE